MNIMNFTTNLMLIFFIMFIVALLTDSMYIMVYSIDNIYLSKSRVISSLYMASTMICAHEIVHYVYYGHFGKKMFITGVFLSLFFIYLMRTQSFIKPNDWLKEMIPHHSTAITTTTRLLQNNKLAPESDIYKLAENILITQKREIELMKGMIH